MNDENKRDEKTDQEGPMILEQAHRTPMMRQSDYQTLTTDLLANTGASGSVRTRPDGTTELVLDEAIKRHQAVLSFNSYEDFIEKVLCKGQTVGIKGDKDLIRLSKDLSECSSNLPLYGMNAYDLLKAATEVFVSLACCFDVREKEGLKADEGATHDPAAEADEGQIEENFEKALTHLNQYISSYSIPYVKRIFKGMFETDKYSPFCINIRQNPEPCMIELIWSYWHEEGMLVQTINAISLRFQNKSIRAGKDPLARLELAYLRPLNNLLWGYIQDEQHRLTVARRAYEYDHHYGLTLYGKAVPRIRPADSRSKFIEAFHDLLHQCSIFFVEQSNQQITPDTFPLLNAIKDVHLLLSEGMHNQFGDLPKAARVEMLIQKWILSRPEIKEFLGGRAMTPYTENWMGVVDTMKQLQGWGDVTVRHFHDLAVYGEELLLSIRYRAWINGTDQLARDWANQHRSAIQGYIHSYKAITGVDLSSDTTEAQRVRERAILPSVHLRNRLALNQRRS